MIKAALAICLLLTPAAHADHIVGKAFVSLVGLIADPNAYHARKVAVHGYFCWDKVSVEEYGGVEVYGLYLTMDDCTRLNTANAVKLNLASGDKAPLPRYRSRVLVEGIFMGWSGIVHVGSELYQWGEIKVHHIDDD